MSHYDDDMARGHLETGEPLDALYGTGPWTPWDNQPELPPVVQCPECGGQAYYLNTEVDCENCGIVMLNNDCAIENYEDEAEL